LFKDGILFEVKIASKSYKKPTKEEVRKYIKKKEKWKAHSSLLVLPAKNTLFIIF
jgi:hypothetical protein